MKNFYITLLLSFFPMLAFSQGENNNWYFGNHAALNFQNPTPTGITTSAMDALEACGSVSDSNGNLLFYMNGERIWDRNNQVMPNGILIPPYQNDTAEQLAIVKNPANSKQYYVFTTGENSSGNPNFRINYSIVDMSLAGNGSTGSPLGDVILSSKNTAVLDNLGNIFMSEAVTVIPNVADNSFWVLIPNGNTLYSYKLSSTGFTNGNPVISNLNFPVNLTSGRFYGIKASPKLISNNFSHYICVSYWFNSQNATAPDSSYTNMVYSFNVATGQITNDYSLQINGLRGYVPEFNKSATVLFLGYKHMYAVDLFNSTSSGVISMQLYNDTSTSGFYGMGIQRNKFGDIYVSKPNSPFLGRVINPDSYGSSMSVNLNAVGLMSGGTKYGLPQPLAMIEQDPYYPCINNLTLDIEEPHAVFTYNVSNDIVTKDNYLIVPDYDITMVAGNSITLLPNTNIMAHNFLARIAPCNPRNTNKPQDSAKNELNQKGMVLELDKEERTSIISGINVFPNPVSDVLNIKSMSRIQKADIYDISGKKINTVLNGNTIDIKHIPSGSYLITIETKEGKTTKKFIKK
ncbi:T9SS type A sorting domain-containing protein [Chryseobacterium gambrini]|uniref:T9SS type A sorting domain-containing protein n=1 Tax=Chryseobacterium gambrini TaxID=373672 RepID=UPI0022F3CE89|nr:T9SS type A sorting domain-containing protein [Chryseobacterium gambrini]WBX96433.1 T9SS type A sorting domain-containing protein [Chryseobacterium gambrini]